MYRVPRATYRLQFNAGFTFADAAKIVPYLAELGISDVYASPILKARRGSSHGYDVVDADSLNPELGTDDDFNALHNELQRHQLGLLLDIVPNHMAASSENAWWMSVLENGEHSRYLHYFDIDLTAVTSRGQTSTKVLLPILGKPYGDALEAQEIQLHFDSDGFYFSYYDKRLPLSPGSYNLILRDCVEALPPETVSVDLLELVMNEDAAVNSRFLKETLWRIYEQDAMFRDAIGLAIGRINGRRGDAESFNALDALLDAQAYRLAYWRIASEKINYRRFFDVTDLVGVRVENPEVFEARNRRTLELIAEGKVTGLRIDHIDGLYDPIGHMRKLQSRLSDTDDRFYIVLEKILEEGEELRPEFPVSGTTGYDFLASLNNLFIDSDGLQQLGRFYRAATGLNETFADVCYQRKRQVIHELFSGEMRSLGKQLGSLAMADRNARDFAPVELTAALTEVTACMRIYRTYVRSVDIDPADRKAIQEAIAGARSRSGTALDERLFTFLERVLLVDPPPYVASEREHWLSFVMRWQQFTGRVMAKGVEDTAFYNYNRLISLNEVGGEPGRGADLDGLAEFHARNVRIQRHWPHTMNVTATHDTKRGEDGRARIHVLSEMAPQWEHQVRRWSKMNAARKKNGIPHPNEELLLYQTLIGIWPLDDSELPAIPERLQQYLEKAAREAKNHTSWIAPDRSYEEALLGFAGAILSDQEFRTDFLRFQKRVAFYGFLNSLSQVVLKATAPGAPDFYQGTELWDFSMVDPDNRRPVDYQARGGILKSLKAAAANGSLSPESLLRRWQDGIVKLFVTWKVLEAREKHAARFRDGTYEPVEAGKNVVAFIRRDENDAVLVAVPRLISSLAKSGALPLGDAWGDATIAASGSWRNVFTGETHRGGEITLSRLFATFPVAVLEKA
ncbi:MAG: (1-_4)-alpha-D-glucan 1-alpha-D-glucosylmutase [Thermoanaerobaculia bacterium]|jgi:(1->4)-alpha-D-glucan 1-alpha-D-glucosylmutase|nr:(1->4)-alpha-D-glucan 1-alpha-D-glucosylmutase [Thermoanaerobaculia bacterium]